MSIRTYLTLGVLLTITAVAVAPATTGGDPQSGYQYLTELPMAVGPAFGTIAEEEWDQLWRVFPQDEKDQIQNNPSLKQKITLERYGLFTDPSIDGKRPVGFVQNDNKNGKWEMNCLVCHGGRIPTPNGPRFYIGAPATTFDVQSFVKDRINLMNEYPRASKLSLEEKMLVKAYEKVIDTNPINHSRGTYNVWTSGDAFLALRKPNMGINYLGYLQALAGHPPTYGNQSSDMDPPAWWNTKYKDRLFIDGFAPKIPRMLSIIIMAKDNPVVEWDRRGVFSDVLSFINQVENPQNEFSIDHVAASRGKPLFENKCASCHGTYANTGVSYPGRTIPLDRLGTDSGRLIDGMTVAYREQVLNSWAGDYGRSDVRTAPTGYMPPPLRGVWASAPYFHNGSAPTLYHVLFPQERPAIWKSDRRTLADAYDPDLVGFKYETATPEELDAITDGAQKREYFDSRLPAKSIAGHTFPEALTRSERLDVLEYLKTL